MSTLALETIELTHHFARGEVALERVNLRVERGKIYGFLGPNGAGKTTTLKLALGLLRKQKGSIRFFGNDFENDRQRTLQRIGSLIETPSLYLHLNAHENLLVLQKIYGCDPSRIPFVLNLVGLASAGRKRVGAFSLGMKQRLAIAVAMLHEPELLILDEPTNGLDPNGMIEMRELLQKLNREHGVTIVISSHILNEIEKLVDDVGIINKGRILYQGSLAGLRQKQLSAARMVLSTSDNARAMAVIHDLNIPTEVVADRVHVHTTDRQIAALINKHLVGADIEVYELSRMVHDLEKIFMNLLNEPHETPGDSRI